MKLNLKLLMALAIASPVMSYAQDKTADEYKNDGNAFVREKNYQDALVSYQEAFKLWGDSLDAATVYAAADCAKKLDQADKAVEYYQKAIDLDYKADYAKYYIADIWGKQGKSEEKLALLEESVPTCQDAKVKSFMTKALMKDYRDKAMKFYNEGNKILGECQTAKPEQYAEIQGRAKDQFKQAKPWIDKALSIDPNNATLKQINDNLKEQLK